MALPNRASSLFYIRPIIVLQIGPNYVNTENIQFLFISINYIFNRLLVNYYIFNTCLNMLMSKEDSIMALESSRQRTTRLMSHSHQAYTTSWSQRCQLINREV